MNREDEIIERLDRIAGLLERMVPADAAGSPPRTVPQRPRPPVKDLVSIRHRDFTRSEEPGDWDPRDGGPPPGGGHVDPETFWSRGDEYEGAMKRKPKKMGRRFE